MTTAREIAVNTVMQVLENKAYSNIALNKNLNNSELIEKDKALATELVYGTIKYKYSIDKILKRFLDKNFDKIDKYILNILRVCIYQIKYLDKVPAFAAVNEGVNLAKKESKGASKLVNGVLRNYIRNKDEAFYDEGNIYEKLAFLYSYPQWIIKLFINQYGESTTEKILYGLNMRPAVTVRANTIKDSYDNIFNNLVKEGYNVEVGSVAPEAIRINKGSSIEDNRLFNEGYITVQDESAMLVAPAMDLTEGLTVLDLCSAPGGKTTHIAEIMNNSGIVKAFDIHEHKLQLIKNNIERLGLSNIKLEILDATILNEELIDSANRVLIDVPCSGLGIIRKKPEIKYTKREKELKEIIKIQRKILETAAKYVKSKGVLLYSTCTINKNENEDNIKWFIKNNSEFEVEKVSFGEGDNLIYNSLGTLTVLPNETMDGFFIAKLRKK